MWFRSSLPLGDDGAGRSLVTLTAILVFLAGLALSGAFVVQNMVARWHADISGAMTIQVIPRTGDPEDAARQTREDVDRIVEIVTAERGVTTVRVMGDDELKALMEPWLGSGDIVSDLPLPRLIALTLKDGGRVDADALQTRLRDVAPGVQVEDHRNWLSGLVVLARGLSWLAWATVGLVAFVTSIAVVQATKSALIVHWPMIEVLHLIGAQDGMIARRFERRTLKEACVGGVIGVVLVLLVLAFFGSLAGGIESGIIPALTLTPFDWFVIACLPLISGALALGATRWAVLRTLRRML